MPDESHTPSNRLLVPLIAACAVCAVEAVVIAFLLGRSGHPGAVPPAVRAEVNGTSMVPPPPHPATQPAPPADTGAIIAAPQPAPPSAPAMVRGKVHQRVEAAGGLAITVLDVADQPRVNILTPPGGEKFADCDVLLENTGKAAISYYAVRFKIQDDQAHVFDGNAIGGGGPRLGFGTIVPGGKVRGHVAFDLPRDAKGLTLTYSANFTAQPQSIQIDLGR